jgi:uncharacterized SAM-binding protein YcdF (DUF218 family)
VRWISSLAAMAAFLLLALLFWPGRFHAEKMLTELALPLGLVWFALLVIAVVLAIRGGRSVAAMFIAAVCSMLSVVGNFEFGNMLVQSLERPYLSVEPLNERPFDAIAVLGGGAWVDVKGRPVLGAAGDRVVFGARLFDAGKAPLLVCTGGDLEPAPNLPSVAEMTSTVLQQLGVPANSIVPVGGDTTKSELAALKRAIDERAWKRVGIVTSAWHMPRVERLARSTGVEFVPLPADFRSPAAADLPLWDKVRRFSIIPSSSAVQQAHVAVKEYLAVLAGR